MPPLQTLWSFALTIAVVWLILHVLARRHPRDAPAAARHHLGGAGVLTVLLTGAALGPWALLAPWSAPAGLAWVQAGGGPSAFETLRLTAEPAEVTVPAMAFVFLTPAVWLILIPSLAQVTWPRATGPRRSAGLGVRRWSALPSTRGLVLLGASLALAGVGALRMSGVGALDALRLESSAGPESTTFTAWASGRVSGASVLPWIGAGVAVVLVALVGVVWVTHRRRALGGLTPREDLAARRLSVDDAIRVGAALISWMGLAALAAGEEARGHERVQAAVLAAHDGWSRGTLAAGTPGPRRG